jgi:tetratricopeptide (TPR) repeat protein
MPLGRVFVSSVFGGMLELRQRAAAAARLLGLDPVLTETHVAQPGAVRDALKREIALADLYVGLFDRRRGTVPPSGTVDARAITEEEFRLARELGLRCLVFLSRAAPTDREPGLAEFLEGEVGDYATGVWARPYDGPGALGKELTAALSAARPRVVLALGAAARLFLAGLQPAWTGAAVLGPLPVDLALGGGTRGVFDAFRRGPAGRDRLRDEDLRAAGGELATRALPGPLGEALGQVLDLAAGRLLPLEVRTEDAALLALPWELLSLPRHPLPVREGKVEVVRRLLLPGDADDPARDPAPAGPADRLAVLGFTAAPTEDQALGALPGAGGLADADLFWEQEQERLLAALDDLVREGRGRLILPDTGDREELRRQLARSDRPQVVHLSCHGGAERGPGGVPEPVLYLEDADGHRASLAGPELLSWVRAGAGPPPELLVLSACSTAGAVPGSPAGPGLRASVSAEVSAGTAAGLAERLVAGGLPRVLGMQSTVTDRGATAFAGGFYAALGRGVDLPTALRAGRVELAAHGGPHEWAIPTLTLHAGAGPLAAPPGSAPPLAVPFEAPGEEFRIAGVSYLGQGYVGRREAERRLGRACEGERVVVLHGLGGIGKSTLAARFLERRRQEGARVLVLYAGRLLAPAALLDEVAAKVGVVRPAGVSPAAPEVAEAAFREALGTALRAVVPTFLLLDNFEDNQDEEGRLRNPELGSTLFELARLAGAGLHLLLTSRLAVELPPSPIEARNLDLGELSPSGCRKLRLLDPEGLGQLEESAWQQVLRHLGGHPKALELLGGYLRGKPDRARGIVRRLDEAIRTVDGNLSAKDQERGRRLLVDEVLESVPESRRAAFDRLCLLFAPLHSEELESLLTAEGVADANGDVAWFRDQGLLARAVGPAALTGGDLVHRLLASRRSGALAEHEGEEAARAWHLRVAEHLVARPGPLSDLGVAARHRDAAGDRAGAIELYDRWAIQLRNRHAYAACVQIAREGLAEFPAGEAEAERVGAANLLLRVNDGLMRLGKIGEADQALAMALQLAEAGHSLGARFTHASALLRQGRRFVRSGRVAEATSSLQTALDGFTAIDQPRDRAIVLGDLAYLRAQAGDVAGALKLHEERLATFEQLGDVRERAVTLGHVARLRAQAGDVAGALKLHEEMLAIFEQLGDVRSRAVTLGDVARLRAQAGDVAGALKLHEERLATYEQLGDVRSRAVTLGDVARLRAQAGDIAGALKLQSEGLEVSRRLGDLDGIGAAQFALAKLDLAEERTEEARIRLAEAWEIVVRIGRVDAIAAVGSLYGQLLLGTNREQARAVLQRSRDAFQRLGWQAAAQEVVGLLEKLERAPASPEPAPARHPASVVERRSPGWLYRLLSWISSLLRRKS